MAATLSTLRDRAAVLLADSSAGRYSQALLDEAFRQALAEYNLTRLALDLPACTLQGLDGAAATTLPEGHEGLIVLGAAGVAAAGRAMDRVEKVDLNQSVPAVLAEWGQTRLAEFRRLLAAVRAGLRAGAAADRLAGLHTAAAAPWGELGWQLDSRDGESL